MIRVFEGGGALVSDGGVQALVVEPLHPGAGGGQRWTLFLDRIPWFLVVTTTPTLQGQRLRQWEAEALMREQNHCVRKPQPA